MIFLNLLGQERRSGLRLLIQGCIHKLTELILVKSRISGIFGNQASLFGEGFHVKCLSRKCKSNFKRISQLHRLNQNFMPASQLFPPSGYFEKNVKHDVLTEG
jgi:hypothetical protein